MQRRCDRCGKSYEAKRPTSKYCSSSCRARQSQSPKPVADLPTKRTGTDLHAVTERELTEAGRLDTVLGRQALELAQRITSSQETGSAVASLSKEFRAVMEAAMEGVGIAADPLDELRARRERKRSAG